MDNYNAASSQTALQPSLSIKIFTPPLSLPYHPMSGQEYGDLRYVYNGIELYTHKVEAEENQIAEEALIEPDDNPDNNPENNQTITVDSPEDTEGVSAEIFEAKPASTIPTNEGGIDMPLAISYGNQGAVESKNPALEFAQFLSDNATELFVPPIPLPAIEVNRLPTFSGIEQGDRDVTEADDEDATGKVDISDPDVGESCFRIIASPMASNGGYGTYTNDRDGNWNYALNSDNPEVNALREGATLTDTITLTSKDGTTVDVTITITGTNDDPIITGEDGGDRDVTEVDDEGATGKVDINDPDTGESCFLVIAAPMASNGGYGTYTNDTDGNWNYALNSDNPEVNALREGATLTDTITLTAKDDTTVDVTITITGTNDDPIITGEDGGDRDVTEVDDEGATGKVDINDPDTGESCFLVIASPMASNGGYGTFTNDTDGNWSYALDSDNPEVNALREGATLTDTITLTAKDDTTVDVTITITGTNDDPIITGEDGGDRDVTEVDDEGATGKVDINDPDTGESCFLVIAAPMASNGGYGTYTNDTDGNWNYALNSDNPEVNALREGATLTDTITLTAKDGTTVDVTITITGTNDDPIITGEDGGDRDVTEVDDEGATGKVDINDPDTGESCFLVIAAPMASNGGYGTYTNDTDGNWNYALNSDNPEVNALREGATLTDTITLTAKDDTTVDVTITITGTNDDPIITGEDGGDRDVTEVDDENATGKVDINDPDTGESCFLVIAAPMASNGGYGTYTNDTDGNWNYALNSDNPEVNALREGATLTDTITLTAKDGTTVDVSITINGTNDAASIGGDNEGDVQEDGILVDTGLLTITDDDTGEDVFQSSNQTGTYGDFSLLTDGNWTYTLDNTKVQTLDEGEIVTDTFTVFSQDGSDSEVVTINITGEECPQVSTNVDENSANATVSLREAITCSNMEAGTQVITLDALTYTLSIVGTNEDGNLQGDLDITDDVIIEGKGIDLTVIDAATLDRVFDVLGGATLTLRDLTVTGGISGNGSGIAVDDLSNLVLEQVKIDGNNGNNGSNGGGIFTDGGDVTISDSIISNNSANDDGGGLFAEGSANVIIDNTTISGNRTGDNEGGGLYLSQNSTTTITNSTISGNSANEEGGGIHMQSAATLMLDNSTISGNESRQNDGGGIHTEGGTSLTITNSTITNNESNNNGGGISHSSSGTTSLTNTIVAGNKAAGSVTDSEADLHDNGSGAFSSGGHNLIGIETLGVFVSASDQTGTVVMPLDPMLGALANNGGDTQTHALLAGSSAINAGIGSSPDQRSAPVVSGTKDIGAFEFGGVVPPVFLDLDGDGLELTSVNQGIKYDIDSDGTQEQVSWVSGDDGLLAIDIDNDNAITQASEFVFTLHDSAAQTDYEALRNVFDSNTDGYLSVLDDHWFEFGIWQDANQDGIGQEGEFSTLDALGYESLQLYSDGVVEVIEGNIVYGKSELNHSDNSSVQAYDVGLVYTEVIQDPDELSLQLGQGEVNSIDTGVVADTLNKEGNTDCSDCQYEQAATAPVQQNPVLEQPADLSGTEM